MTELGLDAFLDYEIADADAPATRHAPGALGGNSPRVSQPRPEPGQLWLMELHPDKPQLSRFEARALTAANVVIYDPSLAAKVAAVLPLGGYAEPAGRDAPAMDRASLARSVRFALDGWSVLRLIDGAAPGRAERLRRFAKHLAASGVKSDLALRLIDAAEGRELETIDTRLDASGGLVGSLDKDEQKRILLIATLGPRAEPYLYAVSANGPAG